MGSPVDRHGEDVTSLGSRFRTTVQEAGECAVRELNPGRELGKLESYHWTNGTRGTQSGIPYRRT